MEIEGGSLIFYLVFQLLALYVLLYALQEVIGVEVRMSRRMPERRQRVSDKKWTGAECKFDGHT